MIDESQIAIDDYLTYVSDLYKILTQYRQCPKLFQTPQCMFEDLLLNTRNLT